MTDNRDATCLVSFFESARPVFNGLLLVVVKVNPEVKGKLI